jgi:hypothetical protein
MSRLYFSMNLFDDGRFHSELLLAVHCVVQKNSRGPPCANRVSSSLPRPNTVEYALRDSGELS